MQIIAISCTGLDSVVGNINIVGTIVDESSFGTLRSYWNKKTLSNKLKRKLLLSKLGDKVHNHIVRTTKKKGTIPELIMFVLNSFKEFWKYRVYIDYKCDNLLDLLEEKIPHNLKVMQLNIKDCDLRFTPHKSTALSWAIAEEYKSMHEEYMERVWGPIGNNTIDDPKIKEFLEKNKDCPEIREEYRLEVRK